ncbi:MAG: LysM peptidoglycan-binding domain-containing protein [Clostridia bacterium]|nr:LysM peptidoglycan-binding domain-containing protein [Clostridia bacterium]MBQ8165102.1 LysM peptidoglycan-binding domain-containing protein [Clostridia bacterium]
MTKIEKNNALANFIDTLNIFKCKPICGRDERAAYRRKKELHKKAITVAVIVMAVTILTGGMLIALAKDNADAQTEYSELIVENGDTLWSIAKENFPDSDPRDVIQEIREINGLDGFTIYSGKVLLIPVDK